MLYEQIPLCFIPPTYKHWQDIDEDEDGVDECEGQTGDDSEKEEDDDDEEEEEAEAQDAEVGDDKDAEVPKADSGEGGKPSKTPPEEATERPAPTLHEKSHEPNEVDPKQGPLVEPTPAEPKETPDLSEPQEPTAELEKNTHAPTAEKTSVPKQTKLSRLGAQHVVKELHVNTVNKFHTCVLFDFLTRSKTKGICFRCYLPMAKVKKRFCTAGSWFWIGWQRYTAATCI